MKIFKRTIKNFFDFESAIDDFRKWTKEKSRHVKKDYVPVFRGVREKGETLYLNTSLQWNNLVEYEYDMINELRRFEPFEFNGLSGLDLLGKCQHYGLPSRLLDFSFSHYVALFFSVTDLKQDNISDKKCKVYCMAANLRNEVPATNVCRIAVKMQPAMYSDDKNNFIDDIIDFKNDELKQFIKRTLSSSLFVYPKFYTEREKMQQSVFLIMPNKIKDTVGNMDFTGEDWQKKLDEETSTVRRYKFLPELYNPLLDKLEYIEEGDCSDYDDDIFWELTIPNDIVKEIKEKLDAMGIDEAFLFPDNLEYITKKIVNKYKEVLQEREVNKIKAELAMFHEKNKQ